ncbi:hypothetical protein NDU88_006227 [Pleurodeles waltl]|uniref:Uncharacterized protein n=1 Tax=Pleurodeles waltl TaxID=8319 RepID=A0AAV7WDC8_PLEWA|nr:hypothetical protein NDU88_006227 [Pleurodeles waltl]
MSVMAFKPCLCSGQVTRREGGCAFRKPCLFSGAESREKNRETSPSQRALNDYRRGLADPDCKRVQALLLQVSNGGSKASQILVVGLGTVSHEPQGQVAARGLPGLSGASCRPPLGRRDHRYLAGVQAHRKFKFQALAERRVLGSVHQYYRTGALALWRHGD